MFHHIGIYVKNMEKSKKFYIEILKTIGYELNADYGKPGIRKQYGNNYYAAFVYDYDGNNIEIVCDK